ncbi:MAG: DUF523 and DUF1722 domain-containing protein [Candidatus Krumholzibacteriota bacterium]
MKATQDPDPRIRLGVSACLLGREVRYDGEHARDRFVVDTLGRHLTLIGVCPEDELGMGTPRETVRLVGDPAAPKMLGSHSATDWTARMNRWSARRARELGAEDLCGYVFKKNSPSCGVFRVKVYTGKGNRSARRGRGLFVAEFSKRYPLMPIEDEERLHDPGLRENFLERIFAYRRLTDLFRGRWRRSAVVEFQSREKFLLMAHSPAGLPKLDQLIARNRDYGPAAFRDAYIIAFMEVMALKATSAKHAKVLKCLAGYLRDHLSAAERKRVLAAIEDYRRQRAPLTVPVTLLGHYIDLHEVPGLAHQTYLNPHPRELLLRNHV